MQRLFGQALMEPMKVIVCLGIGGLRELATAVAHDHHRAAGGLGDPLAGQSAEADASSSAMQELSSIYETAEAKR